MLLLPLAVALAASAPLPVLKLAAPGLFGVRVEPEMVAFCNEQLAHELRSHGAEVVTDTDIRAVLGLEQQRVLLGCSSDSSSCLAEIANGLGADAVLVGSVARLDNAYRVQLKAVSTRNARVVLEHATRAASDSELVDAFASAAAAIAPRLSWALQRALRPTAPGSARSPGPSARAWAWAPGMTGVTLLGAGAYGLWQAQQQLKAIAAHPRTKAEAEDMAESGQRARDLGGLGLGLGAAALGVTAVMLLTHSEAPASVSLGVTPGLAEFSVSGSW